MLIIGVITVAAVVVTAGGIMAFFFLQEVQEKLQEIINSGYLAVTIRNYRSTGIDYNLYIDGSLEDSDYIPGYYEVTMTFDVDWIEGEEATHLELAYGGESQDKTVNLRDGGTVQATFYIT